VAAKKQTSRAVQSSPTSPWEAWEVARRQFDQMTDDEKIQTLKEAGILNRNGRLAEQYREPLPAKPKK